MLGRHSSAGTDSMDLGKKWQLRPALRECCQGGQMVEAKLLPAVKIPERLSPRYIVGDCCPDGIETWRRVWWMPSKRSFSGMRMLSNNDPFHFFPIEVFRAITCCIGFHSRISVCSTTSALQQPR